jgi:hypothetical protein
MTSWCLAGALAASLTWNWTQHRGALAGAAGAVPASASAEDSACAGAASCSLGGEELAFDPAVQDALAELCQSSCGESDLLERRADELEAELLASLSAPTLDPAATARLVDEVGELRKRSLAACVEGILGVREVLSPAQVHSLLARCEAGAASCR